MSEGPSADTIQFEDGSDYLTVEASGEEITMATQGRIPNDYELNQNELHDLIEFLKGESKYYD